jgi:CheY-like chemotaxis protein
VSEELERDTVLVIDDNVDFCQLISMLGQFSGVRVLEATDCRKALEVLVREQARIKMVLLDYFMPGMRPTACARAITAKLGPLVPIVLVTAGIDPSARAAELHLSRWIAKPVDPSILKEMMTETPIRRVD